MAVPNDLRVVSAYRSGVGDELAGEARTADLFVGTRPYGDPDRAHRVEEDVLFKSGRACVFLPPKTKPVGRLDTVLVAWKNTRECARAVGDAIPFLQQAQRVVVAAVTGEADQERHISSGADLGRYLSRHGIVPEIKEVAGWHSAQDALLAEVTSIGPQLIVAGAYGHTRLRERLLGGVTRALLERASVPVLMSR
jgi:nucleotide-binding universal stress UspA family protein